VLCFVGELAPNPSTDGFSYFGIRGVVDKPLISVSNP
jgi:hypothetical protein